jgi:hypothetical protein
VRSGNGGRENAIFCMDFHKTLVVEEIKPLKGHSVSRNISKSSPTSATILPVASTIQILTGQHK